MSGIITYGILCDPRSVVWRFAGKLSACAYLIREAMEGEGSSPPGLVDQKRRAAEAALGVVTLGGRFGQCLVDPVSPVSHDRFGPRSSLTQERRVGGLQPSDPIPVPNR